MRKLISIVGISILGSFLIGEEGFPKVLKNEISFGLGRGTLFEIPPPPLPWGLRTEKKAITPVIFVSYMYETTKRFSFGGMLFYQKIKGITKGIVGTTEETEKFIGILVKVRGYYYNGEKLKLSRELGGGLVEWNEREQTREGVVEWKEIEPIFQITPLGISYGKNLSFFFRVGLGPEGIINGGISYRF
jgi:hypothetical protein